jgi:LPXTG-site transpeptidase (sortase) family protein
MNSSGNPLKSDTGGWRRLTRVLAGSAGIQRLTRGRPAVLVAGVGIVLIAVVAVAVALVLTLGGDGEESQVMAPTPGATATATADTVSAGLLEGDENPSPLTLEDLEDRGPTDGSLTDADLPDASGRLVISAIGIDAPLTVKVVGSDGAMPNPNGPEDVALYDFSVFGGLGGWPGVGGNVVLSGHVDYHDYGPAVFWRLRELQPGNEIELRLDDGSVIKYTVKWSRTVGDAGAGWDSIVASTTKESLTLITCEGTFDPSTRSYDARRVVWAERTS